MKKADREQHQKTKKQIRECITIMKEIRVYLKQHEHNYKAKQFSFCEAENMVNEAQEHLIDLNLILTHQE